MSKPKPKYNIDKVSFEWVKNTNDKKEIKKAYEAIKAEGGFWDLEKALKDKLASIDPVFRRQISTKPISKEEKEAIDQEMDQFLASANHDDEDLQGKHVTNIFSNPKEEAANRIGIRKQAENERLKGNDLMKTKEYDGAIECYNKSISLDSNEAATYSNRALAYINKKQYSKAIEDANKAIEIDSKFIKAYYRRGKAYESCKRYEEAIKDYEYILEREPKNNKIKRELISLRQAYKEHNDNNAGGKKFRKMKIEETDENTAKVEEINDVSSSEPKAQTNSEEPVIEDEEKENVNVNETRQENTTQQVETNHVSQPTPTASSKPTEKEVKQESEFVKVEIDEASSDEEDNKEPEQQPENQTEEQRLSQFDIDTMKKESVSDEFINSLNFSEPEPETKVTKQTKETKKEDESKSEAKVEEDTKEEVEDPQDILEAKFLEEIDSQIEDHKEQAKIQHAKGMFQDAIEIYQEALLYIESKESNFKNKTDDVVIRK